MKSWITAFALAGACGGRGRTSNRAGRPAGDLLRRPAGPSEPAKPHAGEPALGGRPEVIFVVGVNGVGKTTSIAKLAHFYLQQNRHPLLAAADTFRAAANEQLEIWAGRLGIQIVMQKPGADPAAVLFDALASAKKRNDDPVIVDTAGRLHRTAFSRRVNSESTPEPRASSSPNSTARPKGA